MIYGVGSLCGADVGDCSVLAMVVEMAAEVAVSLHENLR